MHTHFCVDRYGWNYIHAYVRTLLIINRGDDDSHYPGSAFKAAGTLSTSLVEADEALAATAEAHCCDDDRI